MYSKCIRIRIQMYSYREDRRRGYIGNDYGEDDDEVDYSKMYEEDVSLFVSFSDKQPISDQNPEID